MTSARRGQNRPTGSATSLTTSRRRSTSARCSAVRPPRTRPRSVAVVSADSSPAQRYAAARKLVPTPAFVSFQALYDFPLDEFQLEACRALEEGHGVLVAAPTGSGKTLVGEFAVHLALAAGQKCFYTTPIKALSNQKYADLVERHGVTNIGLLTGDNSVNSDASVVVHEIRPIPLWQHMLVGSRMFDLFDAQAGDPSTVDQHLKRDIAERMRY